MKHQTWLIIVYIPRKIINSGPLHSLRTHVHLTRENARHVRPISEFPQHSLHGPPPHVAFKVVSASRASYLYPHEERVCICTRASEFDPIHICADVLAPIYFLFQHKVSKVSSEHTTDGNTVHCLGQTIIMYRRIVIAIFNYDKISFTASIRIRSNGQVFRNLRQAITGGWSKHACSLPQGA